MAMDFFGSQDQARKLTGRLVFLFGLALLGIVASVYVLFAVFVGYGGEQSMWQPQALLLIGGVTVLVVGGASMSKISQLSGGGSVVAEALGGRLIQHDSADGAERRVLNVVEEMAIASGTPVPPVYVMDDEEQINAFAAGFKPENAVIGVTRGCIEKLKRDELQGVIAHEFSHIFNGDMRLNIRLMGGLFGIMAIGFIGYFLLRTMFYTTGSRRGKDDNRLPILALALGLIIIGAIGTFFGKMIQSAVSRQREFLADASAVQFTRNPEGIGGALIRLGAVGTVVHSPNAQESSHMFFGQAITSGIDGLMATHPPLPERIRRINPSWDGTFPAGDLVFTDGMDDPAVSGFAGATGAGPAPAATATSGAPIPLAAGSLSASIDTVGQLDMDHVARARQMIDHLPSKVLDAARSPYGARAVLFALIINPEPDVRQKQLDRLRAASDQAVANLTEQLMPEVDGLDRAERLPLLDLAAPALRSMTSNQHETFMQNLEALIRADEKIDLFEWVMIRIARHHMGMQRAGKKPTGDRIAAIRLLVSTLAYAGASDAAEATAAFTAGADTMKLPGALMDRSECGLSQLGDALSLLETAPMKVKRAILKACAVCVEADEKITITEAELLRAVAADLGCPMPPHLPDPVD